MFLRWILNSPLLFNSFILNSKRLLCFLYYIFFLCLFCRIIIKISYIYYQIQWNLAISLLIFFRAYTCDAQTLRVRDYPIHNLTLANRFIFDKGEKNRGRNDSIRCLFSHIWEEGVFSFLHDTRSINSPTRNLPSCFCSFLLVFFFVIWCFHTIW